MHITIAAIGTQKASPEKTLFEQYIARLPWKVILQECEPKKSLAPAARMSEEARLLMQSTEGANRRILLDERGKTLSSRELAEWIQASQLTGDSRLAFLIGGPDGVTEELRKSAALTLSFGRLSWPHMLVRSMLAEQLYRAHTILTGHPYHRD